MRTSARIAITWIVCLPSLMACAGSALPSLTDHAAPGRQPVLDEMVEAARSRFEHGDSELALQAIQDVIEQSQEHVDAQRLQQEILRSRGRMGLLLRQAEDGVQQRADATAHYLHGRIQPSSAAKQRSFDQAVRLDPRHFWAWFGVAFGLRKSDPIRAEAIYRSLHMQTKGSRQAAIALAAFLRQQRKFDAAIQVYTGLMPADRGLGSTGVAASLIESGRLRNALPALLDAIRLRPFDSEVHGLVRRITNSNYPKDGLRELLDPLLCAPERFEEFRRRGGSGALAELLQRAGYDAAAFDLLAGVARRSPAERELFRSLALAHGDVAAYLRDLRRSLPAMFVDDETNQVAGRWRNLLQGPWYRDGEPAVGGLGLSDQVLALADALLRVGLCSDADQILTLALRQPGQAGWTAEQRAKVELLRTQARQQVAFEDGIRRLVVRGYAAPIEKRPVLSLRQLLERISMLSQNVFGRDVVGKTDVFEVPFVGVLWNPFVGGLAEHLAHYNKHLVLGQRSAQPVEGLMLRRLSLRTVDPVAQVPVPPGCLEVVGEHRVLSPMRMADLAGIALLNHYVVDMDQVLVWAESLRRRREIIRADGEALMRDPLPQAADRLEPADVSWRLGFLSPVPDSGLDAAVFDMIRWHELGHMVDFRHYLPITRHPLRGLGLLLRNNFSSERVGGDMEGRAELVALAMSPHTRLVLSHIASFLEGETEGSPHADGFRRIAQRLLQAAQRAGIVDGDRVCRWHLLDPGQVRVWAQELMADLW